MNASNETTILKAGIFKASVYEREANVKSYPNHPFAVLFTKDTPKGKWSKEKILNHYVYKSFETALQAAQNWIESQKSSIEKREQQKQQKKEANKGVKSSDFFQVGDIVVNTWGWEQTNVNFYKVVSMTEKTITVQEIGKKAVEGSEQSHGMSCDMVPNDTDILRDGRKYTLRVNAGYDGKGSLSNPEPYYYFHKWDGRPEYCSWYA